jgi:hypothetical protein
VVPLKFQVAPSSILIVSLNFFHDYLFKKNAKVKKVWKDDTNGKEY